MMTDLPVPEFPRGVIDAGVYRRYRPGPGVLDGPRPELPARPRRILVVGLTASGDVLHFLPVAVALRRAFPEAEIGWVVQDKARAVVEGQPVVDRVHVFERMRWGRALGSPAVLPGAVKEVAAAVAELRRESYELLVDPQGTGKSALVNLVSGVRVRVGFAGGFCREGNQLTTTARVRLPTKRMHRVRKSLALLEALGIGVDDHAFRYTVPGGRQEEADRELDGLGLREGRFVVIHPGTSAFGARKRWPLERFVLVADGLERRFGLAPLFTLGPVELAWTDALRGAKGGHRVLAPSSLGVLAGVLARARAFVGGDSAPLHLASSLRVPVVGLYGPTDPVLFAPYYPPAVVVVQGLACPRCGAAHCNHPVARMEAITAGDVLDGLGRLLALGPGRVI